MRVNVLEAIGDEFDLSPELLHGRTLCELYRLRSGVGHSSGNGPTSLALDMRIAEGDDVLPSLMRCQSRSTEHGCELLLKRKILPLERCIRVVHLKCGSRGQYVHTREIRDYTRQEFLCRELDPPGFRIGNDVDVTEGKGMVEEGGDCDLELAEVSIDLRVRRHVRIQPVSMLRQEGRRQQRIVPIKDDHGVG